LGFRISSIVKYSKQQERFVRYKELILITGQPMYVSKLLLYLSFVF
jgi:hypothetical protein